MIRIAGQAVRVLGYLLSVVLSAVILAGPASLSWWYAAQSLDRGDRLRSYFTPVKDIIKGKKLRREDVHHRLAHLPASQNVLYLTGIVGRYARADLPAGKVLGEQQVSEWFPVLPEGDSMVVPVRVAAEYADNLAPGMQLAFTRLQQAQPEEEGTSPASVPVIETLGGHDCGTGTKGFYVVSVLAPASDGAKATIGVLLEPGSLELAGRLAVQEWTPIILARAECNEAARGAAGIDEASLEQVKRFTPLTAQR